MKFIPVEPEDIKVEDLKNRRVILVSSLGVVFVIKEIANKYKQWLVNLYDMEGEFLVLPDEVLFYVGV